MSADLAEHKIRRSFSRGVLRATCSCGWQTTAWVSARISLAVASHRNTHGLNRRAAALAALAAKPVGA